MIRGTKVGKRRKGQQSVMRRAHERQVAAGVSVLFGLLPRMERNHF